MAPIKPTAPRTTVATAKPSSPTAPAARPTPAPATPSRAALMSGVSAQVQQRLAASAARGPVSAFSGSSYGGSAPGGTPVGIVGSGPALGPGEDDGRLAADKNGSRSGKGGATPPDVDGEGGAAGGEGRHVTIGLPVDPPGYRVDPPDLEEAMTTTSPSRLNDPLKNLA